jgi:pyruvate formate-lyase/glycerol dehydratase family glycyl radical enzyme
MSVTIEDPSLGKITPDSLPRLQKLRKLHFDTTPEICLEIPRLMTQYLEGLKPPEDPVELRAGKMYKYILERKEPKILDNNLLAGTTTTKLKGVPLYPDMAALTVWPELETISRRKKNPMRITREEIDELNLKIFPYWQDRTLQEVARAEYHNPRCQQVMERIIFFIVTKANCIGHTIPNFAAVVNRGLQPVIDEARDKELSLGNSSLDQEKKAFYQAVQLSLQGILAYAANLSRYAADLAQKEADPVRKNELLKMSQVCQRVPAHQPTSFQEAVNAVWLYKVALHQESANIALSPGRLDQVLYPAFRQDLERSRQEGGAAGEQAFLKEAVELVGCLWLKICDHVPLAPEASEILFGGSGSNQAVTLGGVDMAGNDAVNDLTYVMLKATELLSLRDPNVNARYYPGINTPAYLERLCAVNISTHATPCFHNDKSAIEALQGQGVSLAHARDYGAVGCVEPSSAGRTFGHTGAILMNLPAALELALFQGKHRLTEDEQISAVVTQDPQTMGSFADFQQAFKAQLEWLINQAVTLNNNFGDIYQKHHPFPMLSAVMEGCMDSGQDVIQGGAVYNSSGVAMIGLAEVVDSLTAIEEFVFRRKGTEAVSFAQMIDAINHNWQGHEGLLARVKQLPDKFGGDGPLAKANADWLIKFLHDTLQSQRNYRDGKYTVGYWTMTTHAGFGAISLALPSGRQDHETFPSGITPVSGYALELNDVLHFVANLDHTCIANGQALNLKYSPATAAVPKFAQCIEAYFRMGGLQVQSNIVDLKDLKEAQQYPLKHRDLFIRVSGYSAYFIDLNPKMQEEIINRAEYDMNSLAAVPD